MKRVNEPFRDQHRTCPACQALLREFRTRLVCDACQGMMLTLDDLGLAIHDMTSIVATFTYHHEAPGKRLCPTCSVPMTRCKLDIGLEQAVEHPRPELDRCEAHGIWFDNEELAKVFERVAGKGYGGGVGRKGHEPKHGGVDQGGWSAVFKKFGGHGGW